MIPATWYHNQGKTDNLLKQLQPNCSTYHPWHYVKTTSNETGKPFQQIWSAETITAGQERLKQMQESLFGRQSNGGDDVRTLRFKVKEAPVVLKVSISWY